MTSHARKRHVLVPHSSVLADTVAKDLKSGLSASSNMHATSSSGTGLTGQSRLARAKAITQNSRMRRASGSTDQVSRPDLTKPLLVAGDDLPFRMRRPSTAPALSSTHPNFDNLLSPERFDKPTHTEVFQYPCSTSASNPKSQTVTLGTPQSPDIAKETGRAPRGNRLHFGLKAPVLPLSHRRGHSKSVRKLDISEPFDPVKALKADEFAIPDHKDKAEKLHRERSKSPSKSSMKKASNCERSGSPGKMSITGPFDVMKKSAAPIHIGNSKELYLPQFSTNKKPSARAALPKSASAMNFGGFFNSHKPKNVVTKVKDAISDRMHMHGPASHVRDKRSNSHGHHTPENGLGSLLEDEQVQKMLESSPKLQRFFGTPRDGGTPTFDKATSPSQRRKTMQAFLGHGEDALYSDDEDEVFNAPKHEDRNAIGLELSPHVEGLGLIAPWLDGARPADLDVGYQASVTDITSPAGMMDHEKRGQKTASFAMYDQAIISAFPQVPSPVTIIFPNPPTILNSHKAGNGPFDELASGLRQHPEVMVFAEPREALRAGCNPNDLASGNRTPRVQQEMEAMGMQQYPKEINRHAKIYEMIDTPRLRYSRSESMLPSIPDIEIRRASTTSKRSSTDAGLSLSTSQMKKSRFSDPDPDIDNDIALQTWMLGELDRNYRYPDDSSPQNQHDEHSHNDEMSEGESVLGKNKSTHLTSHEPNIPRSHRDRLISPAKPVKHARRHSVAKSSQLFGVSHRPHSNCDDADNITDCNNFSAPQPNFGRWKSADTSRSFHDPAAPGLQPSLSFANALGEMISTGTEDQADDGALGFGYDTETSEDVVEAEHGSRTVGRAR